MLDLLQRVQSACTLALKDGAMKKLSELPGIIWICRKVASWLLTTAFSLWALALLLVAFGWAANSAPLSKVAVRLGADAGLVQSVAALSFTLGMVIRMFRDSPLSQRRGLRDDYLFHTALFAWIAVGLIRLAIPVMPLTIQYPWLLSALLIVSAVQSLGLRASRPSTVPPPTPLRDSSDTLSA